MATVLGTLLCFCVIGYVYAKSEEEIKAWFVQLGMDCAADHPVSGNEAMLLAQHKMPNSREAKCLMACVFKKAGWIDDKGMYNVESAHTLVKENEEDADRAKKGHELFDTCKSVNDETVTDGEEGCDRAGKLFVCLTSNMEKMGLKSKS